MTEKPLQHLKKVYGIALALIALTILSSIGVLEYAIQRNVGDSRIINLAGRQRMLSQRLTKCVLTLDHRAAGANPTNRLNEITVSLAAWKAAHLGLQHGDEKLGLPVRRHSVEITALFASVEPSFTAMVQALENLLAQSQDGRVDPATIHATAEVLLLNESRFLEQMDRITFQFDQEAAARIHVIQTVELFILLVGLLILLLEFLLIFRPSLSRLALLTTSLQQQFTQLQEVNTKHKQAAVALARLAAIVESSDDCIIGKDLNGLVTSWNRGAEKIFGYPADEMIGTSIMRLIPPDLQAEEQHILDTIKRGQSVDHFETVRQRKDGQRIDVSVTASPIRDAVGQIIGVSKVARNITARKQMEAALQQEQQFVRALMDNLPDSIYFKDLHSRFLRVNVTLAKVWGYRDPAQLIGKTDAEFLPAKHARQTLADEQEIIRTGQPKVAYEEYFIWPDGHEHWSLTTKLPLRDAGGQIIGICGISSDITKRKQAEGELRDSKRQLEEKVEELRLAQHQILLQEKLRGLGQMASGIAHDFNNALSPILGFSEFLLKHPEKLADHAQVTKWLTNIHTSATDAAGVVRRIREFSHQKQVASDALTLIDPNQLVIQTIEMTEPSWKDQAQATGRTFHLSTDLQPLPFIVGEAFAIREMLTNLIFNALDAMPKGGTLTLSTVVDGKFVRLSVKDTGTGMTEEVLQRCLEPFFTTKGTEGTGLGLAMASSIVKRHSGRMEIESTLGQGTTIVVRLPIPGDPAETQVMTATPVPTRSLRVLVVDDEPLLCEIVSELLSSDGHTVETVANGEAALVRLKNGSFDLVLTDRAMPKMSGEQLAVAIHQSAPSVPVILMTGFGDIMKADGAMPPHIHAILSKPITETTLREVLAKVFPPQLADQRGSVSVDPKPGRPSETSG